MDTSNFSFKIAYGCLSICFFSPIELIKYYWIKLNVAKFVNSKKMFQNKSFEVCIWVEFEEMTLDDPKYHEKAYFLKWKRGKNKSGVSRPFIGRQKVKLGFEAHFISKMYSNILSKKKDFQVFLVQVRFRNL